MKCTNCGANIPDNVQSCTHCGAEVKYTDRPQKSDGMRIATIVFGLVIIITLGTSMGLIATGCGKSGGKDSGSSSETESTESANGTNVSASAPTEIDSSAYDLVANGPVELGGKVKIATDGAFFLDWGTQKSILITKADGSNVVLEKVSTAYIVNKGVNSGTWGLLPSDRSLKCTGTLRLEGNKLFMDVTNLTDINGNELIVETQQQPVQQAPVQQAPIQQAPVQQAPAVQAVSAQILPQSASRQLTSADVSGLSLRQINYAKNEIYARHGRMFQSPELQSYFNAQSWYSGTIPAGQFKESYLTSIERYNADFLANIEFSISPNGYKLDAY